MIVMGLGFIGQEIARVALESEELEVIGAVDKSPSMAGRTLTEVLGCPAGTFNNGDGRSDCQACESGLYSTSGSMGCSMTCPAGSYKAYVYWRPTVGSGSWTATCKSAAFPVTP